MKAWDPANLNLLWAILSMVVLGAIGGLVNAFRKEDPDTALKYNFPKHILTGIIGALVVPLILWLIDREALNWVGDPVFRPAGFLIFVAFCAIGGIAADSLLKAVTDKLLSMIKTAEKKAEDASRKADSLEAVMTEPESDLDLPPGSVKGIALKPVEEISNDEKIILEALKGSNFYLRSVSGILNSIHATLKNGDFDAGKVNRILSELEKKNMVGSHPGKDGNRKWFAKA